MSVLSEAWCIYCGNFFWFSGRPVKCPRCGSELITISEVKINERVKEKLKEE